jgi:hypothetical protein
MVVNWRRASLVHRVISRRHTAVGHLADFQGANDEHPDPFEANGMPLTNSGIFGLRRKIPLLFAEKNIKTVCFPPLYFKTGS